MRKQDVIDWISQTDNKPTAGMLFEQSKSSIFPQIYLFSSFGIAQRNEIGRQSQITNHFTESNFSIQDHWAISPLTYTLTGLIGEVVYQAPTQWANYAQKQVIDYLEPLSIISPTLDNYTNAAYNAVQVVQASVERYRQIARQALINLNALKDTTSQSNQEYVYTKLTDMQLNRQLVTIYTPYGSLSDMAITSVRMGQNNTHFYSGLTINFQQWRDVAQASQRKATNAEKAQIARLQQGLSNTKDLGGASTNEVKITTLKKAGNKIMSELSGVN